MASRITYQGVSAPLWGVLLSCLAAGACGGDVSRESTRDSLITAAPILVDSVRTPAASETDQEDVPGSTDPLDSLRAEIARLGLAIEGLTTAADSGAQIPSVSEAAQNVQYFGLRVLWTAVVLALAYLAVRTLVWVLERFSERSATRRLFFKRLIPITRLVVWTFAAYYIVANVFEVDRTGLLAATAALGVGIGFAAQGVLKNIFGGLIIVLDQPFQVGDKINVGGTYGEVVSIGLRATRIVTADDNLVSVPNSQVIEGQVANANAGNLDCQVVVDLYLPGWVDVMKAKSIASAAAANSRYVYLEKPITVRVKDEFKETFLTHLVVKAYVLDTRYEFALASDITEAAKSEFQAHGLLRPGYGLPEHSGPATAREPWTAGGETT